MSINAVSRLKLTDWLGDINRAACKSIMQFSDSLSLTLTAIAMSSISSLKATPCRAIRSRRSAQAVNNKFQPIGSSCSGSKGSKSSFVMILTNIFVAECSCEALSNLSVDLSRRRSIGTNTRSESDMIDDQYHDNADQPENSEKGKRFHLIPPGEITPLQMINNRVSVMQKQ